MQYIVQLLEEDNDFLLSGNFIYLMHHLFSFHVLATVKREENKGYEGNKEFHKKVDWLPEDPK